MHAYICIKIVTFYGLSPESVTEGACVGSAGAGERSRIIRPFFVIVMVRDVIRAMRARAYA